MKKTNQLINYSTVQLPRRGFTLIELLIAIAIIGILTLGITFILRDTRTRGRDIKRKQDLAQIQKAIELYNHENGFYPLPTGALGANRADSDRSDWDYCVNPSANPTNFSCLLAKYINRLPYDPLQGWKPASGFDNGWGQAGAAHTYTGNPGNVPYVAGQNYFRAYSYYYYTPDNGKHYFIGGNLENSPERMSFITQGQSRPASVGGTYTWPETCCSYYLKNY